MPTQNTISADEVDVQVTDTDNLPEGWEKTHEEYKRPVDTVSGYYIYSYESKHFVVSHLADTKDGERVHSAVLLKVKRGENGEKLTSIGTGIYKDVVISDDAPEYTEDSEGHIEAHKQAEKAAFQLAVELMREVNAGEYKHKRYSE